MDFGFILWETEIMYPERSEGSPMGFFGSKQIFSSLRKAKEEFETRRRNVFPTWGLSLVGRAYPSHG